jgi:hypothetical protein
VSMTRILFITYLGVITIALIYFTLVGLLGR